MVRLLVGVAAVLASCALEPGDELLTTNHVYAACRNALSFHAERAGARVVVLREEVALAQLLRLGEVLDGGDVARGEAVLLAQLEDLLAGVLVEPAGE